MSLKPIKPTQLSAGRKAANTAGRGRPNLAPSVLVLALSAALAVPGTALATDWVGTTTPWTLSGNWSAGVPDSTTNVLINTNTNTAIVSTIGEATSNIVVGDTAAGTLQVSNGGTLNSTDATLGNAAGSNGKVLVTGATVGFASTWGITNGIFVGAGGAGTLDIQAGGIVTVGTSAVLGLAANSTGTLNVDGTGTSLDIVGSLTVGDGGTGTLAVTGGGSVKSGSSAIGNQAGVTGAVTVDASTWTSSGNITVGSSGTGTLDILAGGVVTNVNGMVGAGVTGQGTVTVDGNGSTWTNTGFLTVGNAGTGTLNIQNGGLVTTTAAFIGNGAAGTSGTVNVDGATGASTFTSTGALAVGFAGNGTLNILNGGAVNSNSADIGSQAGSVGAVTIDGTGSIWTNTLQLGVGNSGTGTLDVTNGGEIVTGGAIVGGAASGVGTVTVTGTGSKWTNTAGVVTIGDAGTGTLIISNGGVVGDSQGMVGVQAGSHGAVTVDGSASFWNNGSNIRIGDLGTGTLAISNGGTVSSAGGSIGDGASGVGAVTVDNSTWNVTGGNNLFVGFSGDGTLNIVNGGHVSNGNGVVAAAAGSNGAATVTGAGSTWTNTGTLTVGSGGTGTLAILSGGSVTATGGNVGAAAGSSGTVTVDGNGSSWANTNGSLNVGTSGTGTLTVQNGALVTTAGVTSMGGSTGGVGTLNVSGANSLLTSTASVQVGGSGTGFLNITGGGKVNTAQSFIGANAGSNGTAVVDGAGSKWTTTGSVFLVGNLGTGTLTISNGGVVSDNNGSVGAGVGGVGSVTVTGTGSQWNNAAILSIGDFGTGTLNVANGGTVTSNAAFIGGSAGATGTATVDGAGSTWNNGAGFTVGNSGTGSLTISNGGTVNATGAVFVMGSNASSGTLSILSGGKLKTNVTFMAGNAGSTALASVDGAGSSWTNNGNISIGEAGAATLNITNGGAVSNTNLGTIANVGGSTGTVRVDGAGSTWSSNNILAVGGNGDGTLTIANGGAVSAATGVVVAGGATAIGALNIGGAAGAAAAAPGTLTAATVQFGLGTGAINFNHTDTSGNYAFDAAISGVGTINHNAGWTSLTGNSAAFAGQTNVNGGTLAVNNMLGGVVTVGGTGILGGNGTVGNTMVNAGGTIAPGNSIGTLNVNGNVAFAANSFFQVETNPAGQSDKLLVSGTATLSGGTVQVIGGAGNYSPATSYSILTAQGGVTGTFANVTSDLAFLDPALSYAANDVTLTLTRNNTPMGGVGQNPGQTNTGNGVQSAGGSLGAGSAVYNAVLGLSAAQARNAFQLLSGEVHASARSVQMQDSHFTRDASLERLRALDSEVIANDGGAGEEEGKARLLPSVRDLAYWARAMGSWGHLDGSDGAATVNRDTAGFLMGADTRFGEEGRFGLTGGYSRSTFDVTERSSSGSSENYHFGAYAGSRWGDLALRTGISYSWHDVSTSRSVAFPGFTDSLKADYKASTTQAFAELGYRIKTEKAELEPFANLAHVNVSSDGFTERGGAAALTSAGNSNGVTFSTVGLRASTKVGMSGGADVTARGSIAWRHAFGDTAPTSTVAFAGGSPFAITGAPVARNVAAVEAGLDFKLTNAATLGVSYSGQFGSGLKDHGARVNLNVAF